MMAPQSTSLVQILYRPHERTTVMGLFGTVGGLSAALGPVVGGLIIHADLFGLDWRPIFLINIPAGVAAAVGLAGLTLTLHLEAGRLMTTWPLVPWLCCAGLGMDMAIGPLSTIVLYHVDVRHAGSASGVLNSVQQLAAAVGAAIGGTLFFGVLMPVAPGGNELARYARAFDISLAAMIALLIVSSLLSLLLPRIEGFLRAAPRPEETRTVE